MTDTMPEDETLVTFNPADYEAIEAAVLETARGRWFLREYARRNRNADTEAVLAAVSGLERRIAGDETARTMDRIRTSLQDMLGAIEERAPDMAPPPAPAHAPAGATDCEDSARRIARIIRTLRFLEERIHAMMNLCDPADDRPAGDAAFRARTSGPSMLLN